MSMVDEFETKANELLDVSGELSVKLPNTVELFQSDMFYHFHANSKIVKRYNVATKVAELQEVERLPYLSGSWECSNYVVLNPDQIFVAGG